MKKLLLVNSLLLSGCSIAAFVVFCILWKMNATYVVEDILWIRALETGMAFVFTVIGIGSFVYAAREYIRSKR